MAFFDPQPVNAGTSAGFSITAQAKIADPFTETNMTWTEIENSTTDAWAGFYVNFRNSAAHGIFLVAKGAASSEVIIAILPSDMARSGETYQYYVPIPVASGTRLSIAASVKNTSETFRGQIVGVPSSNFDAEPSWTVLESGPYILTSTDYGKFAYCDAGATANTKGSYSEISKTGGNNDNNVLNGDSIGQAYDYMGFVLSDNFTTQSWHDTLSDVAYGAATSETIFIPDWHSYISGANINSTSRAIMWVPWGRASGDRISARTQDSNVSVAEDRVRSVLMFGVR